MFNVKKVIVGAALVSGVLDGMATTVNSFGSFSLLDRFTHANDHLAVVPTTCLSLLMKNGFRKKLQLINGGCWAFASVAALETFLYKIGIFGSCLSEKHLLNCVNRKDGEDGFHRKIEDGASSLAIPNGYFISGAGPVYESAKPYNLIDENFSNTDKNMKPVCVVKGIEELKNNIDTIKEAIDKYGAAYACYKVDQGKDNDMSHAVALIGWNDSKRVWLVKDSSDNSKNYYKTLPFSTELSECAVFTEARKYNAKEKIYQHDPYASFGSLGCSDELTTCNVFDFGNDENLKEVTLGTEAKGCSYSLYYTSRFSNGNPSVNQKDWQMLTSGTVPYNGYFTAKIDNPVKLPAGRGAIILKVKKNSANSESSPYVKTVGSESTLVFSEKCGNSYVFLNGKFADVAKDEFRRAYGSVGAFSIKAVTEKN